MTHRPDTGGYCTADNELWPCQWFFDFRLRQSQVPMGQLDHTEVVKDPAMRPFFPGSYQWHHDRGHSSYYPSCHHETCRSFQNAAMARRQG